MKTLLLHSIHEKCMAYLRMIEHANEDKIYYVQLLIRHDMTNFRNELNLWPLGEPLRMVSEDKIKTLNRILDRLENRYYILLLKINTVSIKEQPEPNLETQPA